MDVDVDVVLVDDLFAVLHEMVGVASRQLALWVYNTSNSFITLEIEPEARKDYWSS